MNSRRLDAIRANGNKIIGEAANNTDAASNYRRGMDPATQKMEGSSRSGMQMNDMRDNEMEMNKNLHLVPSRWERSGWRYVQKDPADIQFFQSPNRVNNFGVNGDRKRFASSNQDSFYKSANRSGYGNSLKNRADETTYGRSFVQA